MLDKEFQARFTLMDIGKLLFVSPLVGIPIYWVIGLPWGSSNAPAWVQAIGSITAIIAAWLIPYQHELRRATKEKVDLYHSVGWLAFQASNSLDHMHQVIESSDPDEVDRWRFFGQPSNWKVKYDVISALPISGFTGSDVAYLISLKHAVNFGLECAEILNGWNFEDQPNLAHDFPFFERFEFHSNQLEWIVDNVLTPQVNMAVAEASSKHASSAS